MILGKVFLVSEVGIQVAYTFIVYITGIKAIKIKAAVTSFLTINMTQGMDDIIVDNL